MIPAKPLTILLLIILCAQVVHAQSSTTTDTTSASAYDKTAKPEKHEFPQWARDLRRGEIIAFGTFPFTMFFATFAVDTARAAGHDWYRRYLPWPFKGSGAIEMSTREHIITLSAAIISSVTLALVDHLIVRIKRAKAERERLALPEGELIQLRNPWPPDESVKEPGTEDAAAGDTATNPGVNGTH